MGVNDAFLSVSLTHVTAWHTGSFNVSRSVDTGRTKHCGSCHIMIDAWGLKFAW